jgi:hypothetical protein
MIGRYHPTMNAPSAQSLTPNPSPGTDEGSVVSRLRDCYSND